MKRSGYYEKDEYGTINFVPTSGDSDLELGLFGLVITLIFFPIIRIIKLIKKM